MQKPLPRETNITRKIFNYSILTIILASLYFTADLSYLLFHSLAEVFSITVAALLFMIAWHAREYIKNPYILFVGIAYFFIGGLDLLHTLAYKGMPIFTDYAFYGNQLWIGARYMESITFAVGFLLLKKRWQVSAPVQFVLYSVITILLIGSIFHWKIFPECFVAGTGLTTFKKISEYIICSILLISIILLHLNRDKFDKAVFSLLLWSFVCTIISELSFTFYVDNYGFSNLVGHYFKIFSFFLVYQAIIKTAIEDPYQLIFLELNKTNTALTEEITTRKKAEEEREKLIEKLQAAHNEIKVLEGILPICMFCKKIRDENNHWNKLEQYIHDHSEAKFSHGLCPECYREHNPPK